MRFDLENEFHFQNIFQFLLINCSFFFLGERERIYYSNNQAVPVLVGAVVVVQVVAKLSTIKLSRSRLDDPGADPCPTPDPSLPVGEKKEI